MSNEEWREIHILAMWCYLLTDITGGPVFPHPEIEFGLCRPKLGTWAYKFLVGALVLSIVNYPRYKPIHEATSAIETLALIKKAWDNSDAEEMDRALNLLFIKNDRTVLKKLAGEE